MPKQSSASKTTAYPEASAPGTGRRKTYKGHEIFLPSDERRKRIFIDGRPVRYGLAGDEYYLDVYAYDRAKSLDEVIRRYIDSKERTQRSEKEGT